MTFVERLIPATLTASTRRRDELAFLPAALEIVETPPSPTGRAISASIAAVFCIALIWASIGRVDIIATATGKVVPRGRTKVIQPFETAVVRAIHVRDGQRVKAGDVLVELDPTVSEAELGHLEGDLLATEIARDPNCRLDRWADAHGIAPETVSRGFARAYGITPATFRAEIRARGAFRQIVHTMTSLVGIASVLGFSDQAHMTRAARANCQNWIVFFACRGLPFPFFSISIVLSQTAARAKHQTCIFALSSPFYTKH